MSPWKLKIVFLYTPFSCFLLKILYYFCLSLMPYKKGQHPTMLGWGNMGEFCRGIKAQTHHNLAVHSYSPKSLEHNMGVQSSIMFVVTKYHSVRTKEIVQQIRQLLCLYPTEFNPWYPGTTLTCKPLKSDLWE